MRYSLLALPLVVGLVIVSRFLFAEHSSTSDLLWNWDMRTWTISKSAGGNPDYKVTWLAFGPITLRTTAKWKPGDDRSLLDQ